MFALAGMAVVGFLDDWIKYSNKRSLGLQVGQVRRSAGDRLLRLGCHQAGVVTEISFVRPLGIDLGAFFVIWVLLMLTGWANGVNLADGWTAWPEGHPPCYAYTVIAFWQFRNPGVYESVDPRAWQ